MYERPGTPCCRGITVFPGKFPETDPGLRLEGLCYAMTSPLSPKLYQLVGPDGTRYSSPEKGTLGGYRKERRYGRLDCKAARRALATGRGYEQQRVFFADEATAIAAGYRPCAACMPEEYKAWKAKQ